MKKYKNILGACMLGLLTMFSCDDRDLEEINENPNQPEIVPTNTIFNRATKRVMDNTRDAWVGGRLLHPWVQYTSQINYLEEDKYLYRVSTAQSAWDNLYRAAKNFKEIIDFCENPETSVQMSQYGDLENQIAVSRIMLAYTFSTLAEMFGDIPYYSYGNPQENFQALQLEEGVLNPVYATQEEVFTDILKELDEASSQLDSNEVVFFSGDNIYGGNSAHWSKFANSLRLRIANRVKGVVSGADSHIQDAINDGVFTSNDDNAIQKYGTSAAESNPFWASFFVSNRIDFAPNDRFVKLLKGDNGKFGYDPRLQKMIAPKGVLPKDITIGKYQESSDLNNYQGMPYALPKDDLSDNNKKENLSFFSEKILSADHGEVLMEYAEVEFLLSEVNNWDDSHYKNGVKASMTRWNVDESEISDYISSLPSANAENVITQKYIALFMQSTEAWSEYRRTGYPNGDVLLLPGEKGLNMKGEEYVFTPIEDINHIPYRLRYPEGEQSLNKSNWAEAVSRLGNGDELTSKLIWMR